MPRAVTAPRRDDSRGSVTTQRRRHEPSPSRCSPSFRPIYYVVRPMPGATVAKQIVFDGILMRVLGLIVAFAYRQPAKA